MKSPLTDALIRQVQQLSPRVRAGLGVLAALLCVFVIDWAGRANDTRARTLGLLRGEIETLVSTEKEEVVRERKVLFEDLLNAYEARLVDEGSIGLNIARLQSDLAEAFAECGLERIFVTVDAEPLEQSRQYTRLNAKVRARDSGWVFPVCLAQIGSLDAHLTVTDISWDAIGNLLITLSAAARSGRDA